MQIMLPFLDDRPQKQKTHVRLDAHVNADALKTLSRMIARACREQQREKNK